MAYIVGEVTRFIDADDERIRDSSFCGGTLIGKEIVLTAAHCVFQAAPRVLVFLGCSYISRHKNDKATNCKASFTPEKVIVHPEFDVNTRRNDVAIIKTGRYGDHSRFIRPVCLPPLKAGQPKFNTRFKAVGWGKLSRRLWQRFLFRLCGSMRFEHHWKLMLCKSTSC